MGALLRAEFCKSRRDLNVAILPLALLVAVADSRYIATAQDGTEYTWPLVVANTLFVSANYLMPACLTLLLAQSMQRERQSGMLRNLLVLPVSFRRLAAAKLLAGLALTAVSSIIEFLAALLLFPLTGIPGLTVGGAAEAAFSMLFVNLWTNLALLPLLVLVMQFPRGMAAGTVLAFFWGSLGGMLSQHSEFLYRNPLSAGMALWPWTAESGFYFASAQLPIALTGLAVSVALGLALLAAARDRTPLRGKPGKGR